LSACRPIPARIVTQEQEFLVRSNIKELEEQLDPNQFRRIHRGIIVRVDQVVNARRDLRGRYTLKLKGRSESLRSSQSYGYRFKQM
jgi:DNA-binding LytR/AlgR family response regulator